MPECLDCGNKERFRHTTEGEEDRIYDPETGELLDVVHDVTEETTGMWCAECDSRNVVLE